MRSSSLKISCLALLLAAWGSQQAFAGSIVRLFYDNITGTAISDLTSNAIFPNGSTGSETLTQFFEGTTDTATPDNFGSWIRGYLEAPQNGNYTFWVASDDPSQLWLSTDTTQAHTNLIAYVPDAGYTAVREYTKYASQKSVPIALVKGQKYYVEVFHKEGTGGDNLSVGWTLPDGTLERPILGYRLESYNPPGTALTISAQPQSQFAVEATPVVFFVTVDVGGDTRPTFQWYKGSSAITGETLSSYSIPKVNLADNNTSYYCMVNSTKSDVATLNVSADTTPPALASASTLGYDTFIQVVFSKPVTAATAGNTANYSLPGITINSAALQSDGITVYLKTSKIDLNKAQTLTINGIKDFAATPNTGNNLTAQIGKNAPTGALAVESINNTQTSSVQTAGNLTTIVAGGADIWGTADQFVFASRTEDGDFDYKLDVQSMTAANAWSKCGIMARVSTAAGSQHIINCVTPQGGNNYYSPQFRPVADSTSIEENTTHPAAHYPNSWLRLKRVANIFTCYHSADGTNWTLYSTIDTGNAAVWTAGPMPSTVLVGIATTSHDTAVTTTAVVSDFGAIPMVTIPLAISAQPQNLTVEQSRAAIFSVTTIGDPAYTGAQWYRNGQPIDGANSLSYTNPLVTLTNSGDNYYVVVTNLGYSIQSSAATLTVTPDTTPPSVVLATTVLGTSVNILFSELLDPTSAANKANYTIANVTITSATLSADGMTVVLPISGTLPANFQITINNVKDYVGNTIPANTTVPGYTTGLTPGMISYWPMDEIQGTKTPDIISGYDLNLENMSAANLVAGKVGNCFSFDNARKALLKRVHGTNDALPIYQYEKFTVSVWVNGPVQTDHRIYCESSSSLNNPMFSLGTHNTGANGTLDTYIRNNSGTTTGDHHHHVGIVTDDTWHHIAFVMHATNSSPRAVVYIDGVKDTLNPDPIWPMTMNTTTIGAIQRAASAAWFTGMIDDVAVWSRDLSAEEIGFLFTKGTPIPTPKVLPLVVNSFTSDLPAVAQGDTITIHWDVSKDATSVEIRPNIGNVTTNSTAGVGSLVITVTNSETYQVVVKRGSDSVTKDLFVAAIGEVASGWNLLDNFDRYAIGDLPAPWGVSGTGNRIVDVNGNRLLANTGADLVCMLPLTTLVVKEGEQHTLFARFYLGQAMAASSIDQFFGLNDKGIRLWADANADLGPGVSFQNPSGDLQIGGFNGYGSTLELATFTLQPQTVYNVWIDFRNDPVADGDLYSVFIAKDGDANRTALFTDVRSSRNPNDTSLLGPTLPDLRGLILGAHNANSVVYLDDFYLSKSGYNTTVPHAYGFTTPVAAVVATPPTLSATLSQANVVVSWSKALGTGFVLQGTKSLAKPITWTTVTQPVVDSGTNSTVTIPAAQSYEFYQLVK